MLTRGNAGGSENPRLTGALDNDYLLANGFTDTQTTSSGHHKDQATS
jgi:hypothetical protein